MNELNNSDIDYEHMDDLPLADHIEWSEYQQEDIMTYDFDFDADDWLTA